MQLVRDVLYGLPLERRGVSLVTVQTGNLAENSFDQVTNGHTRRDGVRVDNHVGNDPLHCEGQILLPICQTTSTLLAVATSKLVTDLWNLDSSHLYLDESFAFFVGSEYDLIDVTFLGMFEGDGPIFLLFRLPILHQWVRWLVC